MPLQPRHVAAGMAVLFMAAVVAGGSGVLSHHHSATASSIASTPAVDQSTPTPTPSKPPAGRFTASATRDDTGRIVISGVAAGSSSGNKLTVQRKQGRNWADFPAGTTAGKGGSYSVWLQTSRSGDNVFRVRDEKTGATSDPVTVHI
ncbi:MAG TPA: hypothetical protein VGJ14_15970 [Sporichthyaceae bacterium]